MTVRYSMKTRYLSLLRRMGAHTVDGPCREIRHVHRWEADPNQTTDNPATMMNKANESIISFIGSISRAIDDLLVVHFVEDPAVALVPGTHDRFRAHGKLNAYVKEIKQ